MQPKPINHRQDDFLTLLPIPDVTTQRFGELLLQKMQCQRETPGCSDNTRLSQVCLRPSPSESAASWAIKASGERGDPSSCEAAPAREAARPRCHKRGISCPESPAAGFRHRSFTRKSYSWVLRGNLHVSKLRKAACAAKSLLLGRVPR